jgi:hypothetical protein
MAARFSTTETVLKGRHGAVALVGGGLLLLWGIRDLGASYAATRWPFTPGRVLRAGVVDSIHPGRQPRIEYEYVLAGRVHRSHTISNAVGVLGIPARTWTPAQADSLLARFPPGAEIRVAYDPGDTDHSLLIPRLNWYAVAPIVTGLMLLFYGVKSIRSAMPGPEVP